MSRLTVVLTASLTLSLVSGCATMRIQLPPAAPQPAVGSPIEQSMGGARWQGFAISQAGGTVTKSASVSFGAASGRDSSSRKSHAIEHGGQVLARIDCATHVEQGRAAVAFIRVTATRREYACSGGDYALALKPTPDGSRYVGTVSWRGTSFDVESSQELVNKVKTQLAGFHLTRDGRWVASVESFSGARVFVAPDLRDEEREALTMAVLGLTTSGQALAPTNTTSMAGGLVTSSSGVRRW